MFYNQNYVILKGISDLVSRKAETSIGRKKDLTDTEEQVDDDNYTVSVSMESSEESELDPMACTSKDTSLSEMFLSLTRELSTQANLKPKSKSTKTQTDVLATSTFFQTKTRLVNKATDTTDLNTSETKTLIEETPTTNTAIEVDVESFYSSASEESPVPSIEPSSTDESDESSDETDYDLDKRTILIEGKPPQDQIKFTVFEEAILHVFGRCHQCGSKCTITMENQIGSCYKICCSCTAETTHYYEWTTGPLVNKMATFHLLLASGILATGMETSKVLPLIDSLKIPNVKQRELSNIVKNYVIPAVYSVWQTEQNAQLKEIEGEPIVVASDMHADSPGLFGSGSTLDMGRNIILDTQVIKVNVGKLSFHVLWDLILAPSSQVT